MNSINISNLKSVIAELEQLRATNEELIAEKEKLVIENVELCNKIKSYETSKGKPKTYVQLLTEELTKGMNEHEKKVFFGSSYGTPYHESKAIQAMFRSIANRMGIRKTRKTGTQNKNGNANTVQVGLEISELSSSEFEITKAVVADTIKSIRKGITKIEGTSSDIEWKRPKNNAELFNRLTQSMTESEKRILFLHDAKGDVNSFGNCASWVCNHIGLRLPVEDEMISRKKLCGMQLTQLSDEEYKIVENILEQIIPILAVGIRDVEKYKKAKTAR